MKRIKSCIMVILSLAFVVTGICLFGNPTKEVQAETQYNTDMLSLKFQRGQGSISNKIRVVASVDSPNYRAVGFEIAKDDAEATSFTINTKEYPLPRRIKSTVYNIDGIDMKMDYSFSPKVVDTSSEYFLTGKWDAEENVKYTVRAWARAVDGTKIYGQSRCITLADLDSTVEHLNMSFELKDGCTLSKSTEDETKYADINVTYNGENTTAEVISVKDSTVHVNVNVDRTTLPSATKFVFKNSENTECGDTIFRNLYTSYSETTVGETTTNTADTSWYDVYLEENKDENEFVIATNADLYGLPKINDTFEGKKIYLCADIEANKGEAAVTGWNGTGDGQTSYLWTPVGSKASKFNGIFDGQGHTISGIYVHTSSRAGLFNHTGGNSSIGRFDLLNSYIESWIEDKDVDGKKGSYSGSIAGYVEGKIHDIYSNAVVKGQTSDGTAGIAGAMGADEGTTEITKCHFAGNVFSEGQQVAGIVGVQTENAVSSITDCTVSGSVTSTSNWGGGLVASVSAGEVTITRSAVTSEGQVQVSETSGGLVGYVRQGGKVTVNNSSFAGTVDAGWAVGGLVSRVGDEAEVNILNSSFDGRCNLVELSKEEYAGGFVGYVENGTVSIEGNEFNGNVVAMTDTGDKGRHVGGFVGYVADGEVTIKDSSAGTNGTITARQEAGGFVGSVYGGKVTIDANSSFKGKVNATWAVGGLVGRVNNSQAEVDIKNSSFAGTCTLTTVGSKNHAGGFVGYVQNGTVSIEESNADGTINASSGFYVGGLVGNVSGGTVTISGSSVSDAGQVTGAESTGGLVGYAQGGTVNINNNSSFEGTVSAGWSTGGLVSRVANGTVNVKNANFTGVVTGNEIAGGLVGYVESGKVTIQDSPSNGMVNVVAGNGKGGYYAGGLVGKVDNGTVGINNIDFTGKVNAAETAGGLVGYAYGGKVTINESEFSGEVASNWSTGGLVSRVANGTVEIKNSSFAEAGKVTKGNFSGGFIGRVESGIVNIEHCHADSMTAPGNSSGGIIGYVNNGNVTLDNTYFSGNFSATNRTSIGGLVGYILQGTTKISNSYFDGDLTASYDAGGLIGTIGGTDQGGRDAAVEINNCYADGTIIATGTHIGGLVGKVTYLTNKTVSLTDCLNAASVSGGSWTGGLFGRTHKTSGTIKMTRCLNMGTINSSSDSYVGSAVGSADQEPTVEAVYAVINNTVSKACGNRTLAVTTCELKDITIGNDVTAEKIQTETLKGLFATENSIWTIGTELGSTPKLNLAQ